MFIYQIVPMSVSGVGDGLYKCEENDHLFMVLCPPLTNGTSLAMLINLLAIWPYFLCIHLVRMIQIIIHYFHLLLNKLFLIIKTYSCNLFWVFRMNGLGWQMNQAVSSNFCWLNNSFQVIFKHGGIGNMFWNSHPVPI